MTKSPAAAKPQRASSRSMRERSSPSSSGVKRLKRGAIQRGNATTSTSVKAIHASQV